MIDEDTHYEDFGAERIGIRRERLSWRMTSESDISVGRSIFSICCAGVSMHRVD
jgi:hypothetical protein